MRSAAELLPQIYRKLGSGAAGDEALVLALWPGVVGKKVSDRTRPIRLFGATLIVETVAQDWRKQLAHMRGDIVARLNAAARKPILQDLEFRVAVKSAPLPPRRASSATGAPSDEAAAISDPHLRRIYRQSRRRAKSK